MRDLLSQKILNLPESPTFAMAKKISELKSSGKNIIDLILGEPEFPTPENIKEAAKNSIDSNNFFKYSPVSGYNDLKEAIAKKLKEKNNINASAENIIVSSGAKQSLSNCIESITNFGDEIIVFAPYWPTYQSQIYMSGAKMIPVVGNSSKNFEPDLSLVEKSITPKTKAILFSNPSNPTGCILTKNYLQNLAKLLEKYPNIFIISDEMYEGLSFEKNFFSIGAIESISRRVITINGLSKSYCMTGWRLGYLSAHTDIVQACSSIQSNTTSGPCSITQRAAIEAILGDQGSVEKMTFVYKKRFREVSSFFSQNSKLKLTNSQAGFFVFFSIENYLGKTFEPFYIKNSTGFADYILEKAGVATMPSDTFGIPNYIRISMATNEVDIQCAILQICKSLKDLDSL